MSRSLASEPYVLTDSCYHPTVPCNLESIPWPSLRRGVRGRGGGAGAASPGLVEIGGAELGVLLRDRKRSASRGRCFCRSGHWMWEAARLCSHESPGLPFRVRRLEALLFLPETPPTRTHTLGSAGSTPFSGERSSIWICSTQVGFISKTFGLLPIKLSAGALPSSQE